MTVEVRLPQFGMAMQEGTIVTWYKREGETVESGELLAEIEVEKTTVELTAPEGGVLRIVVHEGATAQVNEVIALLSPIDEPDTTGSRTRIGPIHG